MVQRQAYDQVVYPGFTPAPGEGFVPDLYLNALGVFKSRGNFVFEQVSPRIYPHIVTGGSGTFVMDGRPFPAVAGTVFVFFPGRHYRYFDESGKPWRYTYFHLEGREVLQALSRAGLTPETPARPLPAGGGFADFLAETTEAFRQGATLLCAIRAAWEFVERLSAGDPGKAAAPDLVQACRLSLENRYASAPTVAELSRELGVSRVTLFRAFRAAEGVSPKVYLDRVRLDKAAGLLARSRESVKAIAFACGFSDPSYFCRLFRKRFGSSPGIWQDNQTIKT